MAKYANESYTKGSSKFVAIDPVSGQSVAFSSVNRTFALNGAAANATNFSVKLSVPQDLVQCGSECKVATQHNTLEIRGNVSREADLAAIKAELDRLYTIAVGYFLQDGIVPNVNANLDQE